MHFYCIILYNINILFWGLNISNYFLKSLTLILFLYGCSCPVYTSVPVDYTDSVTVKNYDKNIRYNGDLNYGQDVYQKKTCDTNNPKNIKEVSYLAISGGSDNGSYAAGFLKGWSVSGTRPEFSVVTGVSTGSIIAPFAFLGSDYDARLEEMYTSMKKENVFVATFINILDGITGGLAVSDTSPLKKQLKKYLTKDIIDKIAAENAKGRKLYISTTNLDTQKPVIWDIGIIASSDNDNSSDIIINIILASSALPGVFPPVFFDVTADGKNYKELHVDGGVVSQLLLPPETYIENCDENRKMYLIRNSKLHSEYEVIKPKMFNIFQRSISSIIKYQAYGDLYRMYIAVKNNNIEYNLACIPDDFDYKSKDIVFDKEYMNALFERAYKDSFSGYTWKKNPF